jgi:hypothetical protein
MSQSKAHRALADIQFFRGKGLFKMTMGRLHDGYKEMMRRRDLWTDEMREIHARRKEAVDDCLFALAGLNDADRCIVKDCLRDLFDLEDGLLNPSDVTPW